MPPFPGKKYIHNLFIEWFMTKRLHWFILVTPFSVYIIILQVAAKKISRRHLAETDEYVLSTIEGLLLDPDIISSAYQKMTSLCMNLKDEIFTDMEIHNLHILPRYNLHLIPFSSIHSVVRLYMY